MGKGVVDHAPRDHASLAATLTSLFSIPALTRRDSQAASLWPLLAGPMRADADCPASVTGAVDPPLLPAPRAALHPPLPATMPVPEGSNLQAFLYVVHKTHAEAAAQPGHFVARSFGPPPATMPPRTIAEAQAYIELMAPHLFAAKPEAA